MIFQIIIVIIFALGYTAIIFEHRLGINKAATALLTGALCWGVNFIRVFPHEHVLMVQMNAHLGNIAQVLFFLLGAMTIVELIDSHQGFKIIPAFIQTHSKQHLLWILSLWTFFMSSVLDNVTATIIMVTIARRFLDNREDRIIFASMIIIAANAGGAWSPIGDVTTTMLWIGGNVSASGIIKEAFFPSLVCMLVPLLIFLPGARGKIPSPQPAKDQETVVGEKKIFALGIGALILVPILRTTTGIPPYLAIILGMSFMWIFTDLLHQQQHFLRVPHTLTKIDIVSLLFLLGLLMSVAALETIGILDYVPAMLNKHFSSLDATISFMGLISAIFDNVPLTAAIMQMYDLAQFPMDSRLWEMTAYCVGTGGSILIIGSAAGIVGMGMEKIRFGWYLKKVSLPALAGYLAGLLIIFLK